MRIGNPNTLAIIDRIGVKRIDLKVDITDAAAIDFMNGREDAGIWRSSMRELGEAFRAITAQDARLAQLRQAQQGSMTISIDVKRGDLEAARDGLDHLAGEIAEDEDADNFVIHLRDSKTTIRPDEISVRKTVRLDSQANSVSLSQAWNAMRQYADDLAEEGQLEV